MNEYIAKLQHRYTTKKFDPSRTLDESEIETIQTILQLSPSSTNLQPWHFFIAATPDGKERIAKAAHDSFSYNAAKIRDSAVTVVLCTKTWLDKEYTDAIVEQEDADGRFPSKELKEANRTTRQFFVDQHINDFRDVPEWMTRQTYIALGNLLVGAEHLGLQACPMEGFDNALLAEELGLKEQYLYPNVLVAIGRGATDDFNANTPKSRLPQERIITRI